MENMFLIKYLSKPKTAGNFLSFKTLCEPAQVRPKTFIVLFISAAYGADFVLFGGFFRINQPCEDKNNFLERCTKWQQKLLKQKKSKP